LLNTNSIDWGAFEISKNPACPVIKKESSEFAQLPTITIRKPITKWLACPETVQYPQMDEALIHENLRKKNHMQGLQKSGRRGAAKQFSFIFI